MKNIFFGPDYVTFWTAVNTIATTVSVVALIVTVILTRRTVYLSSKAMEDSMTSFKKSLETSHYTELDNMYHELLKVALEKPYLRNPEALTASSEREGYDIYAYMVWNFIEAIHDRCDGDKELKVTWYPVIDAENRLHRKWFDEERNKHKFKEAFREFIKQEKFKHWIIAAA